VYNDLRCECIDGHDGSYLCVFRQLTRISFLLDSSSWDSTETSVFLRIKNVKWSFLSPWYRETFSRVASGEIGSWDTSWRSSTAFPCCKLRSAEFGGVWLRTGSTWAQGHYGTLIGSHILLVDRYYRHAAIGGCNGGFMPPELGLQQVTGEAIWRVYNARKCFSGQGSAPDSAGGTYYPSPLAGGEGLATPSPLARNRRLTIRYEMLF